MARVITASRADTCRAEACTAPSRAIEAGERINYGGYNAVTHEACPAIDAPGASARNGYRAPRAYRARPLRRRAVLRMLRLGRAAVRIEFYVEDGKLCSRVTEPDPPDPGAVIADLGAGVTVVERDGPTTPPGFVWVAPYAVNCAAHGWIASRATREQAAAEGREHIERDHVTANPPTC